jgi:Oxidoreductase molybdopterin binding domain
MRRVLPAVVILFLLGFSAWARQSAPPNPSTGPSDFKISGTVTAPLDLTLADLKAMPRKTLRVDNAHSKKTEVYEGVLVEDLLQKAGVPQGEQLRGPAMATYVLVEAADNYRVIFSLAEFNSSFQDSEIIVADTNGWGAHCWYARAVQTCGSSRKAPGAVGGDGQVAHCRPGAELIDPGAGLSVKSQDIP